MTIRTKIVISQCVIALAVAAIVGVVFNALAVSNATRQHLESSYEQLHGLMRVAQSANRFSEQVAEFLILGEEELGQLRQARVDLGTSLAELRALIVAELAGISDADERRREEYDLHRIDLLSELVVSMDEVVEMLVPLVGAGESQEAADIFRNLYENRLDMEFDAILDTALERERREVENAIRDSTVQAARSSLVIALVAMLVLVASLGAAFLLHRALFRPIGKLVEGADAVGRGDLSHRIDYQEPDELGHTAQRFNLMAQQLEEQRNRLLQAQKTLEDKVRERTAQLQDRTTALEQANAKLRALDSTRIRFLTDVSHELRTPLTVLRGEAEVALRGSHDDAETYRSVLARVVRKAAQIGRLVDDLLFLARSEADSLHFNFQTMPLGDLVQDGLEDGRVLSQSKRIAIRVEAEERAEEMVVRCDPHRLRQALMTVIDNAVKYSPPGSEVTISLGRSEGHARIVVSDNGAGFSADEINHAFDRFYRGTHRNGAGETGVRGSGLGLSIAKWIVEKHQGHISLLSKEGHGARLVLCIPLADRP